MAAHAPNLPASIHQRLLNHAKERSLSHKKHLLDPKMRHRVSQYRHLSELVAFDIGGV
jgi:hypothetical protein